MLRHEPYNPSQAEVTVAREGDVLELNSSSLDDVSRVISMLPDVL